MEVAKSSFETQLRTMFDLQEKMNTKVHPEWRSQNFPFYRAALVECVELMQHYGYKWWKKETSDMPQVQLEVVDIWHFLLSMFLKHPFGLENYIKEFSRLYREIDQDFDEKKILLNAESLISCLQSCPVYLIFTRFLELMYSCDMTFDELYRQYIGKNVLNFFRQDHGYKDETYVKIWNGREDNEHLVEIAKELDSSLPTYSSDLYSRLEERYALAILD